jgi:hypothetical protein
VILVCPPDTHGTITTDIPHLAAGAIIKNLPVRAAPKGSQDTVRSQEHLGSVLEVVAGVVASLAPYHALW